MDNTAVHPESYCIVEQMAKDLGCSVAELIASKEQLAGIKLIHEMLGSLRAVDMIPQLLSMLEKTTNNEDLLVRIKDWAALMKQ